MLKIFGTLLQNLLPSSKTAQSQTVPDTYSVIFRLTKKLSNECSLLQTLMLNVTPNQIQVLKYTFTHEQLKSDNYQFEKIQNTRMLRFKYNISNRQKQKTNTKKTVKN